MKTLTASLCILLGICITDLSASDSYPRQPGIRILRYTFDVALSDATDEIVVDEQIDVQFVADGVTFIDLDLCRRITESQTPNRLNPCLQEPPRAARGAAPATAAVPTSVGRGMTVTGIQDADGRALSFKH